MVQNAEIFLNHSAKARERCEMPANPFHFRDELLHNLGATLWKVNSGLDPNEAVTAPKISPPNAWGNLAIDQINHQKETPSPSLGNKKTASYSFSMCHGKSLLGWGYLVGHQMLGRWAAPKVFYPSGSSNRGA